MSPVQIWPAALPLTPTSHSKLVFKPIESLILVASFGGARREKGHVLPGLLLKRISRAISGFTRETEVWPIIGGEAHDCRISISYY